MSELVETSRCQGKNWYTGEIRNGCFILTPYGIEQKRKIFKDAVFESFRRIQNQQIDYLKLSQ